MCRPEATRCDEQVVPEPIADRGFDVAANVADDPQLCRFEPEPEQGAREKRPVQIGPVPAHELGAGDDDPGAQRAANRRARRSG